MSGDAREIAAKLTKAQARAVRFLASHETDEWHRPSRETFSSLAADCLIHATPLVTWTFGELPDGRMGGRAFRITDLGRAVAAALREQTPGQGGGE